MTGGKLFVSPIISGRVWSGQIGVGWGSLLYPPHPVGRPSPPPGPAVGLDRIGSDRIG